MTDLNRWGQCKYCLGTGTMYYHNVNSHYEGPCPRCKPNKELIE